jgi:hypothetical protein
MRISETFQAIHAERLFGGFIVGVDEQDRHMVSDCDQGLVHPEPLRGASISNYRKLFF